MVIRASGPTGTPVDEKDRRQDAAEIERMTRLQPAAGAFEPQNNTIARINRNLFSAFAEFERQRAEATPEARGAVKVLNTLDQYFGKAARFRNFLTVAGRRIFQDPEVAQLRQQIYEAAPDIGDVMGFGPIAGVETEGTGGAAEGTGELQRQFYSTLRQKAEEFLQSEELRSPEFQQEVEEFRFVPDEEGFGPEDVVNFVADVATDPLTLADSFFGLAGRVSRTALSDGLMLIARRAATAAAYEREASAVARTLARETDPDAIKAILSGQRDTMGKRAVEQALTNKVLESTGSQARVRRMLQTWRVAEGWTPTRLNRISERLNRATSPKEVRSILGKEIQKARVPDSDSPLTSWAAERLAAAKNPEEVRHILADYGVIPRLPAREGKTIAGIKVVVESTAEHIPQPVRDSIERGYHRLMNLFSRADAADVRVGGQRFVDFADDGLRAIIDEMATPTGFIEPDAGWLEQAERWYRKTWKKLRPVARRVGQQLTEADLESRKIYEEWQAVYSRILRGLSPAEIQRLGEYLDTGVWAGVADAPIQALPKRLRGPAREIRNIMKMLEEGLPPGVGRVKYYFPRYYVPEPGAATGRLFELAAEAERILPYELQRTRDVPLGNYEDMVHILTNRTWLQLSKPVRESQAKLLSEFAAGVRESLQAEVLDEFDDAIAKATEKLLRAYIPKDPEKKAAAGLRLFRALNTFWRDLVLIGRVAAWPLREGVGKMIVLASEMINSVSKGESFFPIFRFSDAVAPGNDVPLEVVDQGFWRAQQEFFLAGQNLADLSNLGRAYQKVRSFLYEWAGVRPENFFRSATFRGKYRAEYNRLLAQGIQPETAAELAKKYGIDETNRIMYNYARQIVLTKRAGEVIPFLGFRVFNLQYWVRDFAQHPWKLSAIARYALALRDANAELPENLRWTIGVDLPLVGPARVNPLSYFTFNDILQMTREDPEWVKQMDERAMAFRRELQGKSKEERERLRQLNPDLSQWEQNMGLIGATETVRWLDNLFPLTPVIRKPLEVIGLLDKQWWRRTIPQADIIWAYTGVDLERLAEFFDEDMYRQRQWSREKDIREEVVRQIMRGETPDRERAEQTYRENIARQALFSYATGIYGKYWTDSHQRLYEEIRDLFGEEQTQFVEPFITEEMVTEIKENYKGLNDTQARVIAEMRNREKRPKAERDAISKILEGKAYLEDYMLIAKDEEELAVYIQLDSEIAQFNLYDLYSYRDESLAYQLKEQFLETHPLIRAVFEGSGTPEERAERERLDAYFKEYNAIDPADFKDEWGDQDWAAFYAAKRQYRKDHPEFVELWLKSSSPEKQAQLKAQWEEDELWAKANQISDPDLRNQFIEEHQLGQEGTLPWLLSQPQSKWPIETLAAYKAMGLKLSQEGEDRLQHALELESEAQGELPPFLQPEAASRILARMELPEPVQEEFQFRFDQQVKLQWEGLLSVVQRTGDPGSEAVDNYIRQNPEVLLKVSSPTEEEILSEWRRKHPNQAAYWDWYWSMTQKWQALMDVNTTIGMNAFWSQDEEWTAFRTAYFKKHPDRRRTMEATRRFFSMSQKDKQEFLRKNPWLKAEWRADATPEERRMYELLDQYMAIPAQDRLRRQRFMKQHPDLEQWLDERKVADLQGVLENFPAVDAYMQLWLKHQAAILNAQVGGRTTIQTSRTVMGGNRGR